MIVRVKNLKTRAIIGVFDWEKEQERYLFINLELHFDGSEAAQSDDIKDTLEYDSISKMLVTETAKTRFDLIEKLAAHLLDLIMADVRIQKAVIEIDKPGAVEVADSVSVVEERAR